MTKGDDDKLPLGRQVAAPEQYAPECLYPIARESGRRQLGLGAELPFRGVDIWHAWEVSWLNARGRPQIACLRLGVPASSPRMVESKSLKLYLQSLNQTVFSDADAVAQTLRGDISAVAGEAVSVALWRPSSWARELAPRPPPGDSLDEQDIAIDTMLGAPDAGLLGAGEEGVAETLHTGLFRSLCPVTAQPDWATVIVRYRGPRMDRQGLLRYLLSYRRHSAFHEQCVEQIYCDLLRQCRPDSLRVAARFLRRGGLDITPVRDSGSGALDEPRDLRQ